MLPRTRGTKPGFILVSSRLARTQICVSDQSPDPDLDLGPGPRPGLTRTGWRLQLLGGLSLLSGLLFADSGLSLLSGLFFADSGLSLLSGHLYGSTKALSQIYLDLIY